MFHRKTFFKKRFLYVNITDLSHKVLLSAICQISIYISLPVIRMSNGAQRESTKFDKMNKLSIFLFSWKSGPWVSYKGKNWIELNWIPKCLEN